ncbi:hypothetical protein GW17_00029855, partial [Ensete ventricosum]
RFLDQVSYTIKIIGARYISKDNVKAKASPRDYVGHGTHVDSIAVEKIVHNINLVGLTGGTARGAVPSARPVVYKVCKSSGVENNDLLDAFDQAIHDGVDIIFIAISDNNLIDYYKNPIRVENNNLLDAFDQAIHDGVDIIFIAINDNNLIDYYKNLIAIGAFRVIRKGILTSVCADNRGYSGSGMIDNVVPRMLTSAASSINRPLLKNKTKFIFTSLHKPRFAISTCTVLYEQYIPVRQVTGTRTGRFRQKSTVDGLKKKSTIGDRLRKKKERGRGKEKKRGEERIPRPPAVVARGSPARGCCPRVSHGRGRFFSRARRWSVSPRGETDRSDLNISAPGVDILVAWSPKASMSVHPKARAQSLCTSSVHYLCYCLHEARFSDQVTYTIKIIGARYINKDNVKTNKASPRDYVGHGTHIDSIVAEKIMHNISLVVLTGGTIRGAVPSARLAVYKVCKPSGVENNDLLDAIDQVIHDGVNIIFIAIRDNNLILL